MRKIFSKRDSDEAAAAVEFGLSLPILLTVFFLVITMGSALGMRQNVSEAASEAARAAAASMPGTTDQQKINTAYNAINRNFATQGLTCGNKLACDVNIYNCNGTFRCISVKVTYFYRDNPLTPTLGFAQDLMPERINYTATAEVNQ